MTFELSGKRLLLVSEDADLSGLVAVAAARLGAEVEAVPSGRSAVEYLDRAAPDAAILDVPITDLGAAELLAACARAGVPAVVVSGVLRGPQAAEEAKRLGARAFFEKPFEIGALAAAVARIVGAPAPRVDGEAPDEVTRARPIPSEEDRAGNSASSPLPALVDPRAGPPPLPPPLPTSVSLVVPPAVPPALPPAMPPARAPLEGFSVPLP